MFRSSHTTSAIFHSLKQMNVVSATVPCQIPMLATTTTKARNKNQKVGREQNMCHLFIGDNQSNA